MAGSDESPRQGRDWQEVLVTVLLVVAALGTSWSSYQATRWNGEQAKAAGLTNGIRVEADARAWRHAVRRLARTMSGMTAWTTSSLSGDPDRPPTRTGSRGRRG